RRGAGPGDPDRRSEPAQRTVGTRRPYSRPPGQDRTAPRDDWAYRRRERTSIRGGVRSAGLSTGGAAGTLRTAANAASHDRDRRLHHTGRTMATRKLLMTFSEPSIGRR